MVELNKSKSKVPSWAYRLFAFLRCFDFLQLIAMFFLLTVGVLFIYSTGQQVGGGAAQLFWKKQIQWIIIGFAIWLILSLSNYKFLAYWSSGFYCASVISLILVLFIGLKIYGARRWLSFSGIRVQPSEFAKLAVLLFMSFVMVLKKFDVNKLSNLLIIGAIVGLPFFLIVREPDLGSALVLLPMTAAVLFIAKLKWRYIIIAVFAVIVLVPSVYPFLKDYQKKRIKTFLFPDSDPRGQGWNSLQSELAVGSGGFWGKGYMQGTQSTLGFLPKTVSNTDFIFSVIAEETGFIGAASVIFMYFLLLASILRTAIMARDRFGKYVAVGIAGIIFTHTFVNIGMSIRLMPITGLPLPFISYGGSFVVAMMAYMGIMQSIHIKTKSASVQNI